MELLLICPYGKMAVATDAHLVVSNRREAGEVGYLFQLAFCHFGGSFGVLKVPQNLYSTHRHIF